jgi:ankyrin repeat protein
MHMQHGLTALHKAAVTGRLGSIRILLEYKADPASSTEDGLTALHLAAWKGQTEALRLLLSYTRGNAQPQSNDGSTPLHEAVRSGDVSCVELLLKAGADASLADRVRTCGMLHSETPLK